MISTSTAIRDVISTVYTFAMPKYVHVQLKGVERTVIVEASEIKETREIGSTAYKLTLALENSPVAKFDGQSVVGWWKSES